MFLGTLLLRNIVRRGISTLTLSVRIRLTSGFRVSVIGGRFHGYVGIRTELLNVLKNSEEFSGVLRNRFLAEVVLILPALWAHAQ